MTTRDDASSYTVAARLSARGKGHDLDRAKRVGAMAAAIYRQQTGADPPRVREFHPGLGGWVDVFAYPPDVGLAILDKAIAEVEAFDAYKAPPPPPGA